MKPEPSSLPLLSSTRFDWVIVGLSAWVVGGLYLDGWAHNHGQVDDSFFTPWHGVLYSGALGLFVFLLFHQIRNLAAGYAWRHALPKGYPLALIGMGLFLLGGLLDFAWHELFGIEVNLEALLSPTHLLLATSGVLVFSAPLRAAYARLTPAQARGWWALGPLVLAATFVLALFTFFTQFAHPISEPDAGRSLVFDQGQFSDIYVMRADGTGQTRLTAHPEYSARGGAWSPDGRQIVFTQSTLSDSAESALYVMNADGTAALRLTDIPGQEYAPAWSPDGTRIAFVSQVAQQQAIYLLTLANGQVQPLSASDAAVYGPVWSPDDTRLAYTSNASGSNQIYLMQADGTQVTQLTLAGHFSWGAAWSPTGAQLVFNSAQEESLDIYVINADGSGEQRLTDAPTDDYHPTWSPSGDQIAFVSWHAGTADIYVMNADGSALRNLTHSHALQMAFPQWSPDGQTILFSASGHSSSPSPYQTRRAAIMGLLLQTALLMGVGLWLVRDWTLPFGALTLMFAVNGLLMSVFNDRYLLALPFCGAGLLADVLRVRLNPAAARPRRFWLFACCVPALLTALYFLVLHLTQGVDWTIHLWLGTIFITGIVGLFVGFLMVSPFGAPKD